MWKESYYSKQVISAFTVPVATLFALLNDKVENPSSRNIYKICKVFGITMAEFYDTDIFNKMSFTE